MSPGMVLYDAAERLTMRIKDYSPITWIFERFFWLLKRLPPQCIQSRFLKERSSLTREQLQSKSETARRAKNIEAFVGAYVVLDVAAFLITFTTSGFLRSIGMVWCVLRIIDIVQVTVNVSLFDSLRGRSDHMVASGIRLVVLSFVNFLELITCFATIYAVFIDDLTNAGGPWDALYFSIITQLTVGYGDLAPCGGLRAVAALQALGGLSFLTLIFVRTIAALPQFRDTLTLDDTASENGKVAAEAHAAVAAVGAEAE
jgi:hypothetical protein